MFVVSTCFLLKPPRGSIPAAFDKGCPGEGALVGDSAAGAWPEVVVDALMVLLSLEIGQFPMNSRWNALWDTSLGCCRSLFVGPPGQWLPVIYTYGS